MYWFYLVIALCLLLRDYVGVPIILLDFLHLKKLTYHHGIELSVVKGSKKHCAEKENCLTKPTNIAEPVQDRIDLTLANRQVQTQFESNGYMHIVWELVGALCNL